MRMKFISKGDGASVELSYYLCVWIDEKEREGHSRQSRQNDHRHRYKHNPCVSIIRGAWIPTSPGEMWTQTPEEQCKGRARRIRKGDVCVCAKSLSHV